VGVHQKIWESPGSSKVNIPIILLYFTSTLNNMLAFPALCVLQWAPAAKPGSRVMAQDPRVTAQDPPQPVPSHHHPRPSQSLANSPKGSTMQSMQVLSRVLWVNGENAH
jgi:hypothetical protein